MIFVLMGFDGLDWIARILEYNISIISNSSPKPVFFCYEGLYPTFLCEMIDQVHSIATRYEA